MVFDVRAWLAEQLHCDPGELELDIVAKRGEDGRVREAAHDALAYPRE